MSAPRPDWQLRPHGTPAAYRRHYRRGTPVCEACRKAEAIRLADRETARRERYAIARAAGLGYREANAAKTSPARLARLLAGVS